jgi:hypothetical protein
LSAWAARFVPTARDEREVQAATSPDNTYATQAVASLRAIRGLRGRLAYASALAFPRRAYLEGRHSGFARRMKQAAAEVLRSTPTEAAPADSKRSRSS